MLNRRPTLILILALLFSALAFPVSAQTTQVEGVVRDASGAVIARRNGQPAKRFLSRDD